MDPSGPLWTPLSPSNTITLQRAPMEFPHVRAGPVPRHGVAGVAPGRQLVRVPHQIDVVRRRQEGLGAGAYTRPLFSST